MSSLDGVGRYYPLTLFAYADPGSAIAPPDIDAQDAWLEAAEDLLLSTLDKDVTFETITGALDQLAPPTQQPTDSPPAGISSLREGAMSRPLGEGSFADLFASLRTANHSSVYAAASFWWTVGGGEYQPLALCCRRMPDPFLFAGMLTGQINSATA